MAQAQNSTYDDERMMVDDYTQDHPPLATISSSSPEKNGVSLTASRIVLASLLIVLAALFLSLAVFIYYYKLRSSSPLRQEEAPERRLQAQEDEDSKPDKKQRRSEIIEAWLVTKPVRRCSVGSCRAQASSSSSSQHQQECAICYSRFRVGDMISFGPSCIHVFHHQCFREWLLLKTDCPCCRATVLALEEENKTSTAREEVMLARLGLEVSQRRATTSFCFRHGVIELSPVHDNGGRSQQSSPAIASVVDQV